MTKKKMVEQPKSKTKTFLLDDSYKPMFEEMAKSFAPIVEIAEAFGVAEVTVRRWIKKTYGDNYSKVCMKFKAKGKAALRKYGMNLAKTNSNAWIFLAKNELGYVDKPEEKITVEANNNLANAINKAVLMFANKDLTDIMISPFVDSIDSKEEESTSNGDN